MKYIDLHIHSTHSDGIMTPDEIVQFAKNIDLEAISITDHDSVDGIQPALDAGKKYGIKVIPGIEISANHYGKDLHILGYFFDYKNPVIQDYGKRIRLYRENRARNILKKLKTCGIDIPYELVEMKSNGGVIGRPHIADILIEEGHAYSFREAFDKYLGEAGKAFEPKTLVNPREAIDMVHQAGGIACIAHPGVDVPDEIIMHLIKMGLDGIEVFHPKHIDAEIRHFENFAKHHNLVITGGSDCHGPRTFDVTIGAYKVPAVYLTEMEKVLV